MPGLPQDGGRPAPKVALPEAGAATYGRAMRRHFLLEDGVVFLNHGSYGATPTAVLAAQQEWRRRLELQPVRFMQQELPGLLREAAAALAAFLGAAGEDLAFVENATTGVNAVLRSLDLGAGDEVLATDHGYPAVRNALRYVCRRSGARLVEARLPFPPRAAEEVEDAVAACFTAQTRLLLLDHITSPSALVLPVEALCARARAAGIRVLIDAAHAPGMVPLNLPAIGADWVVGNAHKWLFAPKGTGFIWAGEAGKQGLHPTVISHGYGKGFAAEFDWVGTRDPSAWLSIGAALDFYRAMGDGELRRHNLELAGEAASLLAAAWQGPVGGPPAMRAAMAVVRLPNRWGLGDAGAAAEVHDRLWRLHRIEVPIMALAGGLWARISAQVYNELDDYRRLAAALAATRPGDR